jgi:DNA mismatch repair protein MutS2
LDWPALVERLADEARSSLGREGCLALQGGTPLASSAAESREALAEVDELANVLRAGRALPALDFPDIAVLLEEVEQGGVLGAEALGYVARVGEIVEDVRRIFRHEALAELDGAGDDRAERESAGHLAPRLADEARLLATPRALPARIRATFDSAGEIRDEVSPTLAQLRREKARLASDTRVAIERLISDEAYADHLQERYFTIREDRFVLPLRASAKSLGLGIVHDSSRTGETVFVEPTPVVALNNRLKLADLAVARECQRILEELAEAVRAAAPALRDDLRWLTLWDIRMAKARLAHAYEGVSPTLVDAPLLDLPGLRHPLLALRAVKEGFRVVPNDLVLGETPEQKARVLVVSGPNAGGKTVYLKAIGLAALMVRAGMLLPASERSRVGFFGGVFADIGDHQTVLGDLSTFSAHLSGIAAILREVSETGKGEAPAPALVLLDEVMAGTNPEQGGALARATLEAFADLGPRVLVVATTHDDALKALANQDPRFGNAGLEYDLEHLAPTFRVRQGVPGRSYAFDMATRMGLPSSLVDRARGLAGKSEGLEQVIAALERREAALEEETARLSDARRELASSIAAHEAASAALEAREQELAERAHDEIEDVISESREALREIVREAQAAGTARAAETARLYLEERAAAALARVPAAPVKGHVPPPPTLAVGEKVKVPSLGGAVGKVVRAPDEKGRLKVAVGALVVDVDLASLGLAPPSVATPLATAPANDRARGATASRRTSPATQGGAHATDDPLSWVTQSANNTLDLRGTRADDVRDRLEAYLDRASLEGRMAVVIIHGHGTGVVKKIVRDFLADSPYVKRWAPGGKGQGGDGVSVVEIAE